MLIAYKNTFGLALQSNVGEAPADVGFAIKARDIGL